MKMPRVVAWFVVKLSTFSLKSNTTAILIIKMMEKKYVPRNLAIR